MLDKVRELSAAATTAATTTEAAPTGEPAIVPRMTAAELALFGRVLAGKNAYLEFGCGGSTVIALRSGLLRLVSVDSDPAWIAKLREREDVRGAEQSHRLALYHADIGPTTDWGAPRDEKNIRAWPKYYTDIWSRHDTNYGVILVDGRFRVACALMAVIFAPDACAVIVHDYNNRLGYSAIERYFDVIEAVDTMVVLQKRRQINMKALTLELIGAAFNAK